MKNLSILLAIVLFSSILLCNTIQQEKPRPSQLTCSINSTVEGICRDPSEVKKLRLACSGSCENDMVCCPSPASGLPGLIVAPPGDADSSSLFSEDLARLKIEDLQQAAAAQTSHSDVLTGDKSSLSHRRLQKATKSSIRKMAKAKIVLEAAKSIAKRRNLTKQDITQHLLKVSLRNTSLEESCYPDLSCEDSPFRRIDGRCNNLEHAYWGSSDTAYQRVSLPDYGDGISTPRESSGGGNLPSARLVSSTISPEGTHTQHPSLSLMVMQWGQFLDHDLTLTPMTENENGSPIRCCNYGYRLPDENLSPDCFPISLPEQDKLYGRFFERCMEFVRSVYVLSDDCTLGPRQQINQLTAYIDASNVYGSLRRDDEDYIELRAFRGGLLEYQTSEDSVLLPPYIFTCVNATNNKHQCFKAGDERVNEQINLAVLHTLWLREHNRLANRLATLNPHWDDERVYQEARRIVAALHQHITYNEFLPIILGREYMERVGIHSLRNSGFTYKYNAGVNAAITNEFGAAAYRFGHTLVPDNVVMMHGTGRNAKKREMPLHKVQIAPFEMYERNGYRELMQGLIEMPSMDYDTEFTNEITGKLFQFEALYGMDLVGLNVQRGRDHGIASYNAIRRACNLQPATSFQDLHKYMEPTAVSRLSRIYRSVEDIDLYVAGVSERPIEGALVGPTFHCILADQFIRLRIGDRYYFEEGGQTGSFNVGQLNQLRKIRLAHVLCNNNDMEVVQPDVFRLPDENQNKRTICTDPAMSIDLDLRHWREDHTVPDINYAWSQREV